MRLIDGTDWSDIHPIMPPFLEPIIGVIGVVLAGLILTIATIAALLFMLRDDGEKGGPALTYAGAVLLSIPVSALRADWSTLIYCALILPAFYGIRWLFRKITTR